jgi:hydrogenase/urease accessory protein HupE
MIETGLQIQLGTKVFRKAYARQVSFVGAIIGDLLQVCGITVPYPDETAAAGEL